MRTFFAHSGGPLSVSLQCPAYAVENDVGRNECPHDVQVVGEGGGRVVVPLEFSVLILWQVIVLLSDVVCPVIFDRVAGGVVSFACGVRPMIAFSVRTVVNYPDTLFRNGALCRLPVERRPMMQYWVNADLIKKTAIIHREHCRHVHGRPDNPPMKNDWLGPFEGREKARMVGRGFGKTTVNVCTECIPNGRLPH